MRTVRLLGALLCLGNLLSIRVAEAGFGKRLFVDQQCGEPTPVLESGTAAVSTTNTCLEFIIDQCENTRWFMRHPKSKGCFCVPMENNCHWDEMENASGYHVYKHLGIGGKVTFTTWNTEGFWKDEGLGYTQHANGEYYGWRCGATEPLDNTSSVISSRIEFDRDDNCGDQKTNWQWYVGQGKYILTVRWPNFNWRRPETAGCIVNGEYVGLGEDESKPGLVKEIEIPEDGVLRISGDVNTGCEGISKVTLRAKGIIESLQYETTFRHPQFSNEQGESSKMNYPIVGISCHGGSCDNKKIYEARFENNPSIFLTGPDHEFWSDWFSNEDDKMLCQNGQVVQQLECNGRRCDNIRLLCTELDQSLEGLFMDTQMWYKTDFFSEEDSGEDSNERFCANGFYLFGMECNNSLCDNIQLYCAPMYYIKPECHSVLITNVEPIDIDLTTVWPVEVETIGDHNNCRNDAPSDETISLEFVTGVGESSSTTLEETISTSFSSVRTASFGMSVSTSIGADVGVTVEASVGYSVQAGYELGFERVETSTEALQIAHFTEVGSSMSTTTKMTVYAGHIGYMTKYFDAQTWRAGWEAEAKCFAENGSLLETRTISGTNDGMWLTGESGTKIVQHKCAFHDWLEVSRPNQKMDCEQLDATDFGFADSCVELSLRECQKDCGESVPFCNAIVITLGVCCFQKCENVNDIDSLPFEFFDWEGAADPQSWVNRADAGVMCMEFDPKYHDGQDVLCGIDITLTYNPGTENNVCDVSGGGDPRNVCRNTCCCQKKYTPTTCERFGPETPACFWWLVKLGDVCNASGPLPSVSAGYEQSWQIHNCGENNNVFLVECDY